MAEEALQRAFREARSSGSLEGAVEYLSGASFHEPALVALRDAFAALAAEARAMPEVPPGKHTMPLQGRAAAAFHARMLNFILVRECYDDLLVEGRDPAVEELRAAANRLCLAADGLVPRAQTSGSAFDDSTRVVVDRELPLAAFRDEDTVSVVLPEARSGGPARPSQATNRFEVEVTKPGLLVTRMGDGEPTLVAAAAFDDPTEAVRPDGAARPSKATNRFEVEVTEPGLVVKQVSDAQPTMVAASAFDDATVVIAGGVAETAGSSLSDGTRPGVVVQRIIAIGS